MKEYNLDFCFKGDRNYVHGTDIFNKTMQLLCDDIVDGEVDLSFHGVCCRNVDIVSSKPLQSELIKFVIKYVDKKSTKKILFGVENNKEIDCRYDYPEENICALAELNIDNKIVSLAEDTGYTFIENIVVLNKFLLENLFSEAVGKWYFARLQLNRTFATESITSLKLHLKSNFNFKLTKTEIIIDEALVGFIYFSLV